MTEAKETRLLKTLIDNDHGLLPAGLISPRYELVPDAEYPMAPFEPYRYHEGFDHEANRKVSIEEFNRDCYLCANDLTGESYNVGDEVDECIELLSECSHPGLLRFKDTVTLRHSTYVIRDYPQGITLESKVHREGPQGERLVCLWAAEICEVLDFLYRKAPLTPFNLKPDYILLTDNGSIKLLDSGIFHFREWHQFDDAMGPGDTRYIPPEFTSLYHGNRSDWIIDCRTGMYQIGANMWHLLAGEAPEPVYPLPDVRSKNGSVGEKTAKLIEKCIRLAPSKRFRSYKALSTKLRRRAARLA